MLTSIPTLSREMIKKKKRSGKKWEGRKQRGEVGALGRGR